jgi:HAMP domain-containing protein
MMLDVTVDGANVVGPVNLDQLRRSVAEGRVPQHAHARPVGSNAWSPIVAFLGAPQVPQGGYQPPQGYHQAPVNNYHQGHGGWSGLHQGPPSHHGGYPPPSQQWQPSPSHPSSPQVHWGGPQLSQQQATKEAQRTAAEIGEAQKRLAELRQELESVEEAIEIQSFGFYRTRYGFEHSQDYVDRIKDIREQQKSAIKLGKATACDTKWTVGGSAAEGNKMVAQQAKLMLRAFNGEADAAIAKVRYDNVVSMEQRIQKSFEELNKLGVAKQIELTKLYFELKLAELRLVHEHREKVQAEKEEQKRIREEMREEQRAREEAERKQEEAEKDEAKAQKELEKARANLLEANEKQHDRLQALVDKLETELKEAIDRKAKAIARAQLTKSGHVYVLSNIGSFGEGVFKIGMTRRLEPLERVDELGDASVPFPFDVHAIIYTEDAPALENKLHKAFAERRVNAVNARKEYFRVTLDEIREEVAKHHGLVTFVLSAEAEEYRKTCATRKASVD